MEKKILTARVILEVVGAPKEHIEKTLKEIIEKLKKESYIVKVLDIHIEPTKQIKEFFSSFSEIELQIKDSSSLIGFCFDYMPSSIELIEPEVFQSDIVEFTGLINDLLAKLHKYDMLVRNLWAENTMLKKHMEKPRPQEKSEEGPKA